MSGKRKNEGTDKAYFTFDVTSGAAPLTVNFTDASTNSTVYEWTIVREGADFTGVSYEQNPTYRFGESGNYTVTLDTDTDSYNITITVTGP
ncbi:Chitin binding protein [Methanosarcina siciliae HI350]|uniref:Chitin binding protein n=1 Tax=Methanosarcina siciliae HI350 TaxID=1434119 RepID=A0A0E3LAN2_9EURY|nr:hypothetical protein [Methanosarcina siciliae]AKB32316.1 Chitin binding protein [Methanosarcina siciliae HI350]